MRSEAWSDTNFVFLARLPSIDDLLFIIWFELSACHFYIRVINIVRLYVRCLASKLLPSYSL